LRVKINNADVNFAYANTQCKKRVVKWAKGGAASGNREPKAKCKLIGID